MAVLDRFTTIFDFQSDFSKLDRLERRIESIRGKLDSVAAGAAKIGGALTAGAGFAVKGFADVETELAKIEGLVGISREQLDAWGDDMDRIARETGKAPLELARALFFVTSAGYRGAEAIEILEQSAKASAAGLGDQAVVADLLTGALGVYRDGTLTSAAATDQLTAAIREGKLDPATLAHSLGTILPFAEAVGVEFGEVAGAMSAMSLQNINANRSATALRGVFTKLLKPTKQGLDTLEEYGLTIDDVRKTISEKGLLTGLRSLVTVFGDNQEALGKVFEDSEALLGVLALTGPAAEKNAGIFERVTGAAGDMDSAFQVAADTLGFRWLQTLAAAQTALVDMGARLAPMAHQLLDMAQAAIAWYSALGDGPRDFIAATLALGPALLGIAVALKAASIALGLLVPSLTAATVAGKLFSGTLAAIGAVIRAHPIALLVTAVAGVILYWDELAAVVSRAASVVSDTLRAWGVPVEGIFAWLSDAWAAVVGLIGMRPEGWLAWLGEVVEAPFVWLTDAWTATVSTVGGRPEGWLVWLGEVIEAPFGWLSDAWTAAVSTVGVRPEGWLAWLGEVVEAPFAWLSEAWTAAVGAIGVRPEDWLVWLTDAWTRAVEWFSSVGVPQVVSVIAGVGPAIIRSNPLGLLITGFGLALSAVVNDWSTLGPRIAEVLEGFDFAGIGTSIGEAIGDALVFAASGLTGLLEYMSAAAAAIPWGSVGEGIGQSIGASMVAAAAALTGLSEALLMSVGAIDFFGLGDLIGQTIGGRVVAGITALVGLLPALSAAVERIDFSRIGEVIGTAIRQVVVSTISALAGLVSGLATSIAELDWTDVGTALWEALRAALLGAADLAGGLLKGLLGVGGDSPGQAITETMSEGVEESPGLLGGALSRLFGREVEPQLPSSDAEEGPLSHLTEAGRAIVETLGAGVREGGFALEEALRATLPALGPMGQPLPVGPPITEIRALEAQGQAMAGGGAVGGTEINIERIEVVAPGGDVRSIAGSLAVELHDQVRRAVERADSMEMA